jgi:uncharacterized damage-inducible protein DinB
MTTEDATTGSTERADILEALATHRHFLRYTTRDLSDDQAAQRTTVSALTLGGLIKHVASVEEAWMRFVVGDTQAVVGGSDGGSVDAWEKGFSMQPGETLAGLLERYDEVARRTTEIVTELPDLNVSQPLPPAPWFQPGARRSARRVLLHIIAETSQHAGHADIIREALDGARTMG